MPSITAARLDELEKKERAHDDYLEAMKRVRAVLAHLKNLGMKMEPEFVYGYEAALDDMAKSIVEAAGRRVQP